MSSAVSMTKKNCDECCNDFNYADKLKNPDYKVCFQCILIGEVESKNGIRKIYYNDFCHKKDQEQKENEFVERMLYD